jgi:ketosteroid isomerase-like protein
MSTEQAAGPTTDNLTAARTIYAAFSSGDIPVVLGMLDPDVEWTETAGSPYAGTYRGAQAVLDGVFARIGADWSEFQAEPEEFIAAGDTVAMLGTYRGTSRATGRSMEARIVHVWHFREGRVVRYEQIVDSATMNAALA